MKVIKFKKGYHIDIESYEGDGDWEKTNTVGPFEDLHIAQVVKGFALLVKPDYPESKTTEKLVEYVALNKGDFETYTEWKIDDEYIEDLIFDIIYDLGLATQADMPYRYRTCSDATLYYFEENVLCEVLA